jgi:hypothetical protein
MGSLETCGSYLLGKSERKKPFGDLNADRRIILKWILN